MKGHTACQVEAFYLPVTRFGFMNVFLNAVALVDSYVYFDNIQT